LFRMVGIRAPLTRRAAEDKRRQDILARQAQADLMEAAKRKVGKAGTAGYGACLVRQL